MKRFNLLIVTLLIGQFIHAQSVGIGTSTPNASAALEIKSSSKGLLIPTMTSTQRTNIASPFNGLLVYDSTVSKLFQYQAGTWRFLINNDYWAQSATRNWVYNGSDSIGIGTASPNERLDVNGNIRSRNNLLVDNNITATGGVSGANLLTSGNITVAGTSFFNGNITASSNLSVTGDVTTNSDLVVNNTTATLQLKSSSVNKGFFQLSGDNVRMGTNSGNSTGNLIIRMNGNDRVTVNAAGDIDLDGKITRSSVTGANSLLPVCFGLIDDAGTILSGSGNFTVSHTGDGVYRITCNQLTSLVIALATPLYTGFYTSALQYTVNSVDVRIHRPGPVLTDGSFSFLIYRAY